MNLTPAQQQALQHLRAAYVGPEQGPKETTRNPPHLQYAVGMLFPRHEAPAGSGEGTGEEAAEADTPLLEIAADVPDGEIEEEGASVLLAEDWRPSSVAISFVTDSDSLLVAVSCATYAEVAERTWQRTPHEPESLRLTREQYKTEMLAGDVPLEIGSRWRTSKRGNLVTVHVRLLTESTGDENRQDIPLMLFQVALGVRPADPNGRILEYDTKKTFDPDPEAAELRLRYRGKKVYAVGHGMAADWDLEGETCGRVYLDPVPAFVVPAVETTGFAADSPQARALYLATLVQINQDRDAVIASLNAFVEAFAAWADEQTQRAKTFGKDASVAGRIAERSQTAIERMREGVDLLANDDNQQVREAFELGMHAMSLQLQNARPGFEPRWRPFQLGFLLIALASTTDAQHTDRDLVDLIWFPTGGGKTEAYLGLAAIEIFRRRLAHGTKGGGTAVITRYTLRLLTSQQFQRAAALICAMELLRRTHPKVKGMTPFSIGLWVGNEVTPATRRDARGDREQLLKTSRPEESNRFQVESCPWCQTPLVPEQKHPDPARYGVRLEGNNVVLHCVDQECAFHAELPLQVVDENIYDEPPTILLSTVDKFARLQFKPEAGRLLGIGTPFVQPTLIIQDELHLLSGPLGTTVAVFDAVLQVLLKQSSSSPKIVASTATIRASDEQVRGLYGRDVALYPPSGIDGDRTFFSRPVENGEGRLYVGLMPQSTSQASAVISAATPLFEMPNVLEPQVSSRDDYWTVVLYHNSLRELGRTSTLVVDDVNGRLEPRATRLGITHRAVRSDKVLELTSRRSAEELPQDLRSLKLSAEHSAEAFDAVLSSNMLSVGIDIPRLALMMMVGQPKTTSEYIQATSRVGRGKVAGVVVTLFRSSRARDRSHFETFRGYHEALYRSVEPTSVTPWSLASRQRSLAGALVALLRQALPPLSSNAAAGNLDLDDPQVNQRVQPLLQAFLDTVARSDSEERADTERHARSLLNEWSNRAEQARTTGSGLEYEHRSRSTAVALLKRFDELGDGWLVADSMRSVEPNVAVEVQEPYNKKEVSDGKDQA